MTLMTSACIPLIVLSSNQSDAEAINRALRDSGHAAHCHWLDSLERLTETIHITDAHLIWLFCDRFSHDIRSIAKLRDGIQKTLPLIAVSNTINETTIAHALLSGAHDLISPKYAKHIVKVAERELRTFRLERALNTSLHSARQYQKQLQHFMEGSDDAIAHVTEGIVIDANPVWAELFAREPDDVLVPVMDFFDTTSHAAIKGALVASQKGQWAEEPLRLVGISADGEKFKVDVRLEAAIFDGEPVVKLCVLRDMPAEDAPEEAVDRAFSIDPSTGLFHRHRLIQAVTERLQGTSASGTRGLAYIRPDKFAEAAAVVGPIASEELLVQFAEVLREAAHSHDICGRFGGTEFAIWIERGTLRDIEAWADGVVAAVAEHIFECRSRTFSLTCTIGIADVGFNADNIDELLCAAQRASQRGRQRGGNQAVLEETSDHSTRVQRLDEVWISQIKSALVENRFQLARLSVASLHGARRTLYDTVIKMIDAQGQEIPASTFLPVAARNRLMRAIDRWVVDAAINAAAACETDSMFVKLSSESLVDAEFLPWLTRCAEAAQIDNAQLCFQVPEESVNQHLRHAHDLATQLRTAGFGFAIEHFGIGRDPTRLLRQIPADYVKLDGSLMQQIGKSQSHQDIVQSLIQAADAAGVATVAERVEDANTMAVLFQLGVGYVQGHYLHEPEVVLGDVIEA
ncbi:MAG: EAL domain-containing protein [Gammaproteobacteria bacterium]|jgi:diguanylate cyclase (GGDEF)-like protein